MASIFNSQGRSPALKFFAVGALTLLMIVPLFLIQALVWERSNRAAEAAQGVASGWGGAQKVSGPFLAVPFMTIEQRDENGRTVEKTVRRVAVFLPGALNVAASADTDIKRRGIFDVSIFRSDIQIAGQFDAPRFERLGVRPTQVLWQEAYVFMWVQDVRGLVGNVALTWGDQGQNSEFEPGSGPDLPAYAGIHAPVNLGDGTGVSRYTMALKLNGTGELSFAPVGRDTSVSLSSDWPHPNFQGAFLPDEPSEPVTAQGFKRQWTVPYLRRSLAQESLAPESLMYSVDQTTFGVKFYQPVDFYQLVDRALKYAILFIGLSFLVFFLIEILTGARVHVVQYLLVGAAQVIFYLLLLSIAEHWGFRDAYLASASATVLLTFLYAVSALKSLVRALVVLVALTLLYGLLFLLLREEDYALLVGSVASFAVLSVTMFVTRRIDWYQARGSALATEA